MICNLTNEPDTPVIGIPVAVNGGANAGLLAEKILATSDASILEKLKKYSENLRAGSGKETRTAGSWV